MRKRRDGVGLALMAVRAEHRGQGIDPHHRFVRASLHGLRWEKPVPDDAFFVQELMPCGLDGSPVWCAIDVL